MDKYTADVVKESIDRYQETVEHVVECVLAYAAEKVTNRTRNDAEYIEMMQDVEREIKKRIN
jgi:hypothetical protein